MLDPIEILATKLTLDEFAHESCVALIYGVTLDNCIKPTKEKMITSNDEVFARLATLEFSVEIRMANELASLSPEKSQSFKDEFVWALKNTQLSEICEDEHKEAEALTLLVQKGEMFMLRITEREAVIRKKRGAG
jgi:hypothetical protein